MIASAEAPRQLFRLGYSRDIFNATIHRLWLSSNPVADQDPSFESLANEMRTLCAVRVASGRKACIYAFTAAGTDHLRQIKTIDEYKQIGSAALPCDFSEFVHVYFYYRPDTGPQNDVHLLLSRASTMMPNRLREELRGTYPTSPIGWWLAFVDKFSSIDTTQFWQPKIGSEHEPVESFRMDTDEFERRFVHVGWNWDDPLIASISAMESAGLIAPLAPRISEIEGEWSPPTSQAEFGRRMLGKRNARARDVKIFFDQFQKQQVKPKLWIFRVDTLSADQRRRLLESDA
jgi:hypothetical protein